jgi:predicted PurR-regulated permease PerM
MSGPSRAAIFGSVGLALLLLLGWFWTVLTPFLVAFAIAYLINPIVSALQLRGWSRGLASFAVLGLFLAVVALALMVLIPVAIRQVPGVIEATARGVANALERLRPWIELAAERLGQEGITSVFQLPGAQDVARQAIAWVGAMTAQVLSSVLAWFNLLSLVFLTPIVAFYLTRDWPAIVATIESWVPRDVVPAVRELAAEIDLRIAGFIRGQLLVCVFLAVFYALGLAMVGLSYALLVGVFSGLMTLIPYIGVLVGMALGLLIALFQFSDWGSIGLVAAVFLLGQFIEGNFVSPRLVGERVALHPVWIMVALVAGGAVGGIAGVLLAIPVAATAAVLLRFAMARYRESRLYDPSAG